MKTTDVDRHVQSLTKTARLINLFLYLLVWFAFRLFFFDFKVIDRKIVPKKGPAIIIGAPHTSLSDAIFMVASIRRPYVGIGMAELTTNEWPWIINKGFELLGHIPIDRGNRESGDAAFDEGLRVLGLGQALFVWPHGRQITRDDVDARWYDGFARFAHATGAPIYLFKIDGADVYWPTHPDHGGPGKFKRNAKVRARFAGPIDPAGKTVEEIVTAAKRLYAETPVTP